MDMLYLVLRTTGVYFLIAFIVRFLGKREVGQLQIFDLIVLLMIADLASLGIEDAQIEYFHMCATLLFLMLLQKLISFINLKSTKMRNFIDGKPSIIVFQGSLNVQLLKKNLYSIDDLLTQMRSLSISCISQIELAILETNGRLSVFPKNQNSNDCFIPIIISGEIQKENLPYTELELSDIYNKAQKENLEIKDIYFASAHHDSVWIAPVYSPCDLNKMKKS